ncbi:MAG: hypothetical protein QM686_21420, partial [Herbaspirillum sp.]
QFLDLARFGGQDIGDVFGKKPVRHKQKSKQKKTVCVLAWFGQPDQKQPPRRTIGAVRECLPPLFLQVGKIAPRHIVSDQKRKDALYQRHPSGLPWPPEIRGGAELFTLSPDKRIFTSSQRWNCRRRLP